PGFTCPPANPLVCQSLQLNSGGSATLTVAVTGTTPGSFNVSAMVNSDVDTDPSNNMQNGTIEILPAADLAVSVTLANSFIRSNESTTVTGSAVNTGPQAATNTQLLIDLGGLLTVMPGQVDPACMTPDGQMLTCDLGIFASGAQQSISQPVDAVGSIGISTVTATVGSGLADSDTSNNNDTASVQVATRLVDLQATIGTLPVGVEVGQSGSFSVTMENLGPDAASQPEVEILAGGNGLSFTSVTADTGSCTFTQLAATCSAIDLTGTQTVILSFNALSVGDFLISATARTIVAEDADTDPANDSASQIITLQNFTINTGGGGGGGGGSPGLSLLGILLLLAVRRRHTEIPNLSP
ncbi:MAG: hypothetical protein O6946_01890, partial [Gammaproteobacteria bacterium]|nr:hypothetical protein [Gammaproteobacteria bacterium]